MLRHDPGYAAFLKEQEERAESAKAERQGRMLAEALRSSFDQTVQSAMAMANVQAANIMMPPPPALPGAPGAPAPSEAPAAAAGAPSALVSGSAGELNPLQLRLLEAELQHKVVFASGASKEPVVKVRVEAMARDRQVMTLVNAFIARFGKNSDVPRDRKQRCQRVHEIACGL